MYNEIKKGSNDSICRNCQNKLREHHMYCGKCGLENPVADFEKIISDLSRDKERQKKINKLFLILFFIHGFLEIIVSGSFTPIAFFPASVNVVFSYFIVNAVLKYKNVVKINRLTVVVYLLVLIVKTIIFGLYISS